MPLPEDPCSDSLQAATPSKCSRTSGDTGFSIPVSQLKRFSLEKRKLEMEVRGLKTELAQRNSEFQGIKNQFDAFKDQQETSYRRMKEHADANVQEAEAKAAQVVQDIQSRLHQLKVSYDEAVEREGGLLEECHQLNNNLELAIEDKRQLMENNFKLVEEVVQLQAKNKELHELKNSNQRSFDFQKANYERVLRELKNKIERGSSTSFSHNHFVSSVADGTPLFNSTHITSKVGHPTARHRIIRVPCLQADAI